MNGFYCIAVTLENPISLLLVQQKHFWLIPDLLFILFIFFLLELKIYYFVNHKQIVV